MSTPADHKAAGVTHYCTPRKNKSRQDVFEFDLGK